MTNILRAAGVPPDVLKLIPATVNCCRICRAFRRPKPHSVATSRAPTAFNDVVQHDILYLLVKTTQRIILWVSWLANKIKLPTFPAQEGGSSGSKVWQQPITKKDSSTDPLDLDPPKQTNAFDKVLRMNQQPCQHMLCICTRLTQAKLITDRNRMTLLKGIQDMWFRPYGAPRVLESDQE